MDPVLSQQASGPALPPSSLHIKGSNELKIYLDKVCPRLPTVDFNRKITEKPVAIEGQGGVPKVSLYD